MKCILDQVLLRKSPYSAGMWEINQKNSEYGHFLCSATDFESLDTSSILYIAS